jgi:PBP1b-binding outer membrane lipoprotein LpoB
MKKVFLILGITMLLISCGTSSTDDATSEATTTEEVDATEVSTPVTDSVEVSTPEEVSE